MTYIEKIAGFAVEFPENRSYAEAKPESPSASLVSLMSHMSGHGFKYHHTTPTGSIVFKNNSSGCWLGDY